MTDGNKIIVEYEFELAWDYSLEETQELIKKISELREENQEVRVKFKKVIPAAIR